MNNGTLPKQFMELDGKPILIYTLENFEKHPAIKGIILVCLESYIPLAKQLINKFHITKIMDVISGGSTGQESIRNGLFKLNELVSDDAVVLVHDGVRPLINEQIIFKAIECVNKKGNAITTSPAIETIIHKDQDGDIEQIIERARCELARAPQCFKLRDLIWAHKQAIADGNMEFIDSACLMTHYGFKLHTVVGPSENIKITTPVDFYLFKAFKEAQAAGEN